VGCVNPYDSTKEPATSQSRFKECVKHATFYDMMRPCFRKDADDKHIMAIFKRAHIILHTDKFVYCRPGTQKKVDVMRMPYPEGLDEPNLFLGPAMYRLGLAKLGAKNLPEAPASGFAWGKEYLKCCKRGQVPPKTRMLRYCPEGSLDYTYEEQKPVFSSSASVQAYYPAQPLNGKILTSLPEEAEEVAPEDDDALVAEALDEDMSRCPLSDGELDEILFENRDVEIEEDVFNHLLEDPFNRSMGDVTPPVGGGGGSSSFSSNVVAPPAGSGGGSSSPPVDVIVKKETSSPERKKFKTLILARFCELNKDGPIDIED
jgi:hypothetical protein